MKTIISNIKKSCSYSFTLIAGASTLAGLWGYTVRDLNNTFKWWFCLIIIVLLFIVLSTIIFFIIWANRHNDLTLKINGKSVTIKEGDLFLCNGWKLIPCNEKFDTEVNNIIITHSSLNGQMIDKYYEKDRTKLNSTIEKGKVDIINKKDGIVPLGKIITCDEFMLLSFTHVNSQLNSYLLPYEYERVLIDMWQECRRVYASKHIAIPLLGSGITDIVGYKKDYTDLLNCILYTLKRSGFQPENGLSIILTQETLGKIDMNYIKEEYS